MSNVSDQQPLVPPALRRFQAVKEQQTLHLKNNGIELYSKSDDGLTPSCSSGSKVFGRHPKSTVHGVVHQFWQLHEQKSGIDRFLSSVGSIFRRMCTQEARTLRLQNNGQNVGVPPDLNSLSPQESLPHTKDDRNCVDKADTGKDDFPVVMVATFEETIPRRVFKNGANSKSSDGVVSEGCDERVSEFLEGVVPKSYDGETKYHDEANFHWESTSNSYGHKHRSTRWGSASSKKQFKIRKHADKSTNIVEKLNSSCESASNIKDLWATPERSKLTQLLPYKHRKLNFSRTFLMKRNCGQKYSLPGDLPLGTQTDRTDALSCDPELDDSNLERFYDSNEDTTQESRRLSPLQRSSSLANNAPNHSQNNLMLPDRTGHREKVMAKKIWELAGFRPSIVDGNLTVDTTGQGQVGSKSNMAATQESVRRFPRDVNQGTCEHLTDSTDELTQLIWAAF